MKKLTIAAIAVLGLGTLASTNAEAQYRRYGGYYGGYGGYHGGYYGGYRRSSGGAIAAGAIFGLAAGALLASAATAPAYRYYDAPVYYAPPRRRVIVRRVVTYPAYQPYPYPYYGGYYWPGY